MFPQTINQAEFIDKPIREILATLGAIGSKSIVVDDTVTGNATHVLSNKPFDEALQIVLNANHLFKLEKNGVITISRIRVEPVDASRFAVQAEGVDLEAFLRRVAREAGKTVLYDSFPRVYLDINLKSATVPEILNTVLPKLPGFTLETNDTYFYLKNTASQPKTGIGSGAIPKLVTSTNGRYAIHARNVKMGDVLDSLFDVAKKEYSNLKKGDVILEKLNFDDKEFEQLLRLVLELADADFTVQDGMYYIVDVNRMDILKKFETSSRMTLKHLSVNQFVNIMPGSLSSGSAFKIDKASNSIILSGTTEEIQPIIDFIVLVDKPTEGLSYYRFDLMNVSADAVVGTLPENLRAGDPVQIKGQNSFLLLLSPERYELAKNFVAQLDRPKSPFVIKLKYIKAEDLVAKLPSFISKEQVSMGLDQRYVFFTGSKDQYADLLGHLRYIDLPVPQIKYQVLVVQYQENASASIGLEPTRTKEAATAATPSIPFIGDQKNLGLALEGDISKTLSLNFDIVSDLGYLFAASLSAKISNSQATIMLDTTLNALSNQDVTFKNTNIYRYAEKEITQDTGAATTTKTITREIVSGITLTLKGWVSGDGMISMSINSTISKRGSGDADNPIPQSSEKLITTSVRTPSGKPIVVGGLMQHDNDTSSNPLYLKDESQNTELMIYIIPRVETPLFFETSLGDSLMYLYNQYSPNGERQDTL